MSAMFLAMVWHARRRQDALRILEHEGAERAALLAQQKRFLHDVSHELRTPVTIARGHLEVLRRVNGEPAQEIEVALDELGRIEHILERLLLLAKSKQPDFVVPSELDLEPFLEDVFVRWSGVVQRGWRLGELAPGRLRADPDALRIALDALLENAVKYTEPADAITLSAHAVDRSVLIEVADEGQGLPDGADERIFERFARADPAQDPRPGRRGPRPRHRRCDREGARRRLLREERRGRRRLHAALPGLRSVKGPRLSLPSRPRRSQLTASSDSWR